MAPAKASCSAAFLLTLASGAACAAVIDDFSVGPIVVTGPTTVDQTALDPAHVIGGSRQFKVGQFGAGSVVTIPEGGPLRFESSGWGYFTLTYGGVASLSGVDLTAGGDDRLVLRFGEIGAGFHPFGVYVNLSTSSSSNGQSLYLLDAWDGITLELPYAALPVPLTSVNKIAIDALRNPAETAFEIESITTGRRAIAGDFNRDGLVDDADLTAWRSTVGVATFNGATLGFVSSADADQNGVVDGADLLVWQRMASEPGVATSMPEPTAVGLASPALLAAAACSARGRRGAYGRRSKKKAPSPSR